MFALKREAASLGCSPTNELLGEYYLFGSLKTKISVHETSSTMIISVTHPSPTNSVIAVEDQPQTRHMITKLGEKLWVFH